MNEEFDNSILSSNFISVACKKEKKSVFTEEVCFRTSLYRLFQFNLVRKSAWQGKVVNLNVFDLRGDYQGAFRRNGCCCFREYVQIRPTCQEVFNVQKDSIHVSLKV